MIDKIHITVQAGSGGNGSNSFYHRKDRKVVAFGGDGGNGGKIIFRADDNAPPLEALSYKRHFYAESGGHGGQNKMRGKNGKDLIILVPEGTQIYDLERKLFIRENLKKGEDVVVLEGGHGGKSNLGGHEATPGEKGAVLELEISVFLAADFFLVGLPNAGKSSLLNYLTRKQLRVEDYPFSTRTPHLGVYQVDFDQIRLCEIPSIFRGSSENRGLGNRFLRHLERARHIILVLDVSSEHASSLQEGYAILRNEIEKFDEALLKIQHTVLVNKMDLLSQEDAQELKRSFNPPVQTFFISLISGEGIKEFKNFLESGKPQTGL
ncbi:MAG: 50S ribosome-binding GTPase [Candidatus Omnitrophica bacterium]|nr:50S ribosome-binding GTPase [Candidatus Omnitrophota bacterium]